MAILNIRNLPDEVHKALRVRAAEHGRSMEAEAREILASACKPKLSGEEVVRRFREAGRKAFGGKPPEGLLDEFLKERRAEAARETDEATKYGKKKRA